MIDIFRNNFKLYNFFSVLTGGQVDKVEDQGDQVDEWTSQMLQRRYSMDKVDRKTLGRAVKTDGMKRQTTKIPGSG